MRLYSDGIKLINNPLANVAPPTAKKIRQRPNTKIKKEIIKFFFIYRVQIERKDIGIGVSSPFGRRDKSKVSTI